jgi:medium-chain acyl-[acyl-carrier-protein] hydrolase
MVGVYESTYNVGSRETDVFGMCRTSSLMGFLQDTATSHSLELGVPRETMMEHYNAFWMIARLWYELKRPIWSGEDILVKTWHRGVGGALIYRDFDIYSGDEIIGEAVSLWVVADYSSRSILRPNSIKELNESLSPDSVKEKTLSKLKMPKDLKQLGSHTVKYSDMDINGHMNNIRYTDIACDAIGFEKEKGNYIKKLEINYSAECFCGEKILIHGIKKNITQYIQGEDDIGKNRFDLCFDIEKIG